MPDAADQSHDPSRDQAHDPSHDQLHDHSHRPDASSPDDDGFRARDLVGLGGFVVGSIVLFTLLGLLLDDATGRSPLGIVLGLAVGIVLAVVGSCVRIARFLRR